MKGESVASGYPFPAACNVALNGGIPRLRYFASYSPNIFTSTSMAPEIVTPPSPEPLPPSQASTINASTPSMWTLSGKTVAVTGGARGIGITLAMGIVESGGHVACLDILDAPSADEWAALQKVASASKVSATYHQCDVTAETAVEEAIKTVAAAAETHGAPFWGVVACAGVQQMLPALEYPASDFDRVMRINVTGVFNTCKFAAQALRKADRSGSIVIIASMSGVIANRVCKFVTFVALLTIRACFAPRTMRVKRLRHS